MAKRKYTGPASRAFKRRRVAKKRRMQMRPHAFKTKRTVTQQLSYIAGFNYGSYKFKLSDLPSYTEFTSLFDSYRLCAVKLTVIPYANSAEISTAQLPIVYSVIDYTDASVPSSANALMEYPYCRIQRMDRPYNLYIKPKVADSLYQGAFTGYGMGKQWVSTASPDVEHYGWKYGIECPSACGFRVRFTYYLMFKDPK